MPALTHYIAFSMSHLAIRFKLTSKRLKGAHRL